MTLSLALLDDVFVAHPGLRGNQIAISVDEYDRYTLGAVRVTGDMIGSAADNLAIAHLPAGGPFLRDAIASSVAALERSYEDRGYARAIASPRTKVDDHTHVVDLEIVITRGRVNYFRTIRILGATRTEDAVRKALTFSTGQRTSQTSLDEVTTRLMATGDYKHVHIYQDVAGDDGIDVRVVVEETAP